VIFKPLQIIRFILIILVIGHAGCHLYKAGTGVEHPPKSISIEPIQNQSFLPLSIPTLTRKIYERLTNAGYQIRDKNADCSLSLVITEYKSTAGVSGQIDSGRSATYNVEYRAELTLVESSSGRRLLDKTPIIVMEPLYSQNAYAEDEYQSTPRLTIILADKIRDLIAQVSL
jgi:hypothetical protein